MEKIKIPVLVNCLVLTLFAAIAMASSSTQEAVRNIDDFSNGWQYGRSLTTDATEEIETIDADTVALDQPLVATND